MPNGGHAVSPDDLGTYRKSEVAWLQASHDDLLAACEDLVHQCRQLRGEETQALDLDQATAAIAKAKPKETP